ncbi:hypothetical protein DH2020_044881 [Rehmannia glutinosa]|uniref:Uncharacterized protein n=1 Tax=Rehmannia glutinosa TaxID=99300 RepID=A0ABR0UFZ4_REHGL
MNTLLEHLQESCLDGSLMHTSSNTSAERRNEELGRISTRSVKEPTIETKTFEVVKNDGLRVSSKKSSGNEGTCTSLTMHGQDIDEKKALRPMFGLNLERGKAIDCKGGGVQFPSANEPSFRRFHSLGEGTSNNPLESMKTCSSGKDIGKPLHIVPYYDIGKYELDKGKVDSHSESGTSTNACFREFNTSLLSNDHHLPIFGLDWFQKMHSKKSQNDDCYSLNKLPNCFHDMETMRICTTVDSLEAKAGGCPKFSQTTHSLLITKKTDVLSRENDIIRTTRLITKMNENTSGNITLSPFFGQGNRGVKLQPLSSSSNSEGKRNVGNVEASKVSIKNESSAETDTMDMEFFMEEKLNSAIVENSPDNVCASSSKTQSLEMDMLMANSEQIKPKSDLLMDDSDPSIRWVKRLKLTSSNSSAHGTKNSNLAENLSHDKMRKYFRSILDSSITSSESNPRKHHGKEIILSDKNGDLSNKDEEFTLDAVKKGNKELLLSHAWIKRWLKNGSRSTEEKPETDVVCEPQNQSLVR